MEVYWEIIIFKYGLSHRCTRHAYIYNLNFYVTLYSKFRYVEGWFLANVTIYFLALIIYQDRNIKTYLKFLINRLTHISLLSELIQFEITQMINATKLFPNLRNTDYFRYPWELANFSAKQASETGFIRSSAYVCLFCKWLLFISCVDFSHILACCSAHGKFHADSCNQSFRMGIQTLLKFKVGF